MAIDKQLGSLLAIMLASPIAHAQSVNSDVLIGNWMYKGSTNQQYAIECPDVLTFKKNEQYVIFNDCYGDAALPIIETGNWSLDEKEGKVILYGRKFIITHYTLHNSQGKLMVYVESISKDEMTICYEEKNSCQKEIYKRINLKISP